MKIIAFIAAILSAATVATLAFTTVPSIQKQAADNAEKIEQIESAVENIPTEEKILYRHDVTISKTADSIMVYLTIYGYSNEKINTLDKLKAVLMSSYNTGSYEQYICVSGRVGNYIPYALFISNGGYPGATTEIKINYPTTSLSIDNTYSVSDNVNKAL